MPVSNDLADQLGLPPMVPQNTSRFGTAFTVSIEAAEGVSTGISAHDRTVTIRTALKNDAKPSDLRRPGHVFPLRAADGGVLVRAGHTEAAVDLCKLAGLRHGGVLSELMHDNGTMMRLPELREFAQKHGIPLISIADLIEWRKRNESLVSFVTETPLETETGMWQMKVFHDTLHNKHHVALVKGEVSPSSPTLVRVHSECLTGDAFASRHCDCGQQLRLAMERIDAAGAGVVLYLRQEGRGIGLVNKVKAYALQAQDGLDTVEANEKLGLPADLREYGIGAQVLKALGVSQLRLLTNNPKKIVGLEGYGLSVVEQIPLSAEPRSEREEKYLRTKKDKMGHTIDVD